MKKTVLFMSVLLTMVGCGGQKSPSGSGESDSATVDSAAVVNEQNDSASSASEEKADDASLLVLTPDLTSIKALDISESNSHKHIMFPVWDEGDIWEDEGVFSYDVNLGANGMRLQTLHQDLPGKPADKNEVMRQILFDINFDGQTDDLICLGRQGEDKALYYDAWLWDDDELGGIFIYVQEFREIPNPAIDKENHCIYGSISTPDGTKRTKWEWKGKKIVQSKD